MAQTTFFNDPQKFFELVFDPSNVIHSVNIINENLVSVSHSKETEFVEVMGNTNTVIAAYTTAQARLHLYSFIEKLQDRVLYFDTGQWYLYFGLSARDNLALFQIVSFLKLI